METILSENQAEELRNLKRHFPFRYCFAALHPDGDFKVFAVYNYPSRKMASLVKKGYSLFELG